MTYHLSICIPTYNRIDCLRELLDSILTQADESNPVEICISDDASTEDTDTLVHEYQGKYPHLSYYRFPQNVGLDRNMLKAVDLAHGEYCWLMGNDDKVEPGAVKLITERVSQYKDLTWLNVNGYLYDSHLKEKLHPRIMVGIKKSSLHHDQSFDNVDDIVTIFGDSFGFLGDNVFRRTLWNEVVAHADLSPYLGSYYIHLAVLLMMLQRSPRFLYVHQQCVGYRGGHDSFLEILGQLHRLRLDAVGYSQVAKGVFSRGSRLYRRFLKQIVRFHIRNRVRSIKLSAANGSMRDVAKLIFKHYGALPAFWIHIFPILLVPRSVLLGLRAFYRATIKKDPATLPQ